MPGTSWLDCVEAELLRRRLPRREVARLVAELCDHLTDLCESGRTPCLPATEWQVSVSPLFRSENCMSTEARVIEALGSPAEIAEVAVREFRQRRNLFRSWLATFCTFVLLPVPLLCAVWVAVIWICLSAATALGIEERGGGDPSFYEVLAAHAFVLAIWLGPAVGVAAFFGWLARRASRSWQWGLAACFVVASGLGFTRYYLAFSELPGKSLVGFGIGWRPQLLPFLLPLTVGFLVLYRTMRKTRAAAES